MLDTDSDRNLNEGARLDTELDIYGRLVEWLTCGCCWLLLLKFDAVCDSNFGLFTNFILFFQ